MNKLEIIATFSAMQKLHKTKNYEALGEVIDEVLETARGESGRKRKPSKDGDKEED